jgi:hypothetical protein
VTLPGVNEQVNPVLGLIDEPRLTVPEKACNGVTVIIEVPDMVALTLMLGGAAVTEKS